MGYKGNKAWMYNSEKEFKLSRGGVESFINCKRCFYIDKKLNVKKITTPPWNLNTAVDSLLKNEFDLYREEKKPHKYMESTGRNMIPFQHEELDNWRQNFKGVRFFYEELNFTLYGAVDDIWFDLDTDELVVVDYKATSTKKEITLDDEWKISYKRQMEFYQWLLRKNEFKVSDIGYFVYCNGLNSKEVFENKMEFDVYLLDYKGSTNWIESTLKDIKALLEQDKIPSINEECETCSYVDTVSIF